MQENCVRFHSGNFQRSLAAKAPSREFDMQQVSSPSSETYFVGFRNPSKSKKETAAQVARLGRTTLRIMKNALPTTFQFGRSGLLSAGHYQRLRCRGA